MLPSKASVCVAVVTALLLCVAVSAAPITWPKKYSVEALFRLPNAKVNEPIHAEYDGEQGRLFLDFYDGLDYSVYRLDQNKSYEVYAKWDSHGCFVSNTDSSTELTQLLPDLSTWTDKGEEFRNGHYVQHYQLVKTNGAKVNTYDFYYTRDGNPMEYHMIGYDEVFESHYDEYILEYHRYRPNEVNERAFDVPSVCANHGEHVPVLADRMGSLLRRTIHPTPDDSDLSMLESNVLLQQLDAEREESSTVSTSAHSKHYLRRLANFVANREFVHRHNQRTDVTHKLALNKFADMSMEEFRRVMLPRVSGPKKSNAHGTFKPKMKISDVPPYLDWTTKGAVTPVKDQGACGSCWTFGAAQAIEGAVAVATGKLLVLSEQNILDCMWDYPNNLGCDGGNPWDALQMVIDKGGIELEETYPYLMVDGHCHYNASRSAAKISKYFNTTEGDEDALVLALVEHGPVAVSIDVMPSLVFYSSGVYYEPNCSSKSEDLNHSVLAVGYGSENGQDYWLIKNSWSTLWGDKGYVKMARNRNNNCGVATNANFAVL